MPSVAPIRTYSLEDGYTDCLIVLEDRELCVWDEGTQTAVPLVADTDGPAIYGLSYHTPLTVLPAPDEPYETPDGP